MMKPVVSVMLFSIHMTDKRCGMNTRVPSKRAFLKKFLEDGY
jgi:hypothetical protein